MFAHGGFPCDVAGIQKHLADPGVAIVGNINVAGAIHRNTVRVIQLSANSGSAIPAVAAPLSLYLWIEIISITRHSSDGPGAGHYLADSLIGYICNVEVSAAIHRHGPRDYSTPRWWQGRHHRCIQHSRYRPPS